MKALHILFSKGGKTLFLPAIMVLLALTTSLAQAPANDACSTATLITCSSTTTGSTLNADIDAAPACGDLAVPRYGVWYRIVGQGGMITLSTCNAGTNFDSQIGVYSGTCAALVCVAGNNNAAVCAANSRASSVTFQSTAGTTYYVWVTGVVNSRGTFVLSVSCTVPPVANDNCSGAITLTPQGATCTTPTSGSTLNATQSQAGCVGTADDDVWYQFVATATAHNVSVVGAASFDAVLQVFSGSCAGLTSLACRDVTLNGGTETATLTGLTVGATYYARVYHYFSSLSATPTFTICVTTPGGGGGGNNDLCSGATAISCGQTVTGTTVSATNTGAPSTSCTGFTLNTAGVWYSYTASSTGQVVVSTCNPGTNFDTRLGVYTDGCGTLTCVGANDDSSDPGCQLPPNNFNRFSKVTFNATSGTTYLIYVTGFSTATGDFELSVTCGGGGGPITNDDCAGAITLTVGATCTPTSGTTVGATQSIAGLTCNGFTGTADDDVWYRFVATATAHTVTVAGLGDFDPVIDVRSGACNGTNIACADATFNGETEVVNLTGLTVGATYLVRVYDWFTASPGAFTICVTTTGGGGGNPGCLAATPIACGQTVTGTTVGGSAAALAPPTCTTTLNTAPGRWHTIVGNGLSISLTTCAAVGFDTKLAVFSGSCAALTCVAGNDDAGAAACSFSGLRSTVSFQSQNGVTYYIYVTGFGTASGAYQLTASCRRIPFLASDESGAADLIGEVVGLPEGNLTIGEVFPNPLVGNTASIRVDSPKETEAIVRFMDQMGREVMMIESDLNVGDNLLQLNISRLPAGTYFVMVQVEGQVIPRRLVIPRA